MSDNWQPIVMNEKVFWETIVKEANVCVDELETYKGNPPANVQQMMKAAIALAKADIYAGLLKAYNAGRRA